MLTFQPGDRIGEYRVTAALAHGYRADHMRNGRRVLIKVELGTEISDRIARATRVLSVLEHPGVAQIVECGALSDGRVWIASDLPDGPTLYDLVMKRMLRADEVASLIHDVAEVLSGAHERGVLHGKLRLHSIVLTNGDFPVSIGEWDDLTDEDDRRYPTCSPYAAPEAKGGTGDGRIDVYALGVIAFRALTGHFPGAETSRVPNAPLALAELMIQMLARDPASRPSAGDVQATMTLMLCSDMPMAVDVGLDEIDDHNDASVEVRTSEVMTIDVLHEVLPIEVIPPAKHKWTPAVT